jgi:ribosomal protein S18 acetylase RimI-like enzyme
LSQQRPQRCATQLGALGIRPARFSDVSGISELALDNFGDSSNSGLGFLLNQVFKKQITDGFSARIQVSTSTDGADHNVFVLADDAMSGDRFNGLRGLIELSLQPCTGDKAPAMPVSLASKRLSKAPLRPYISNLVIDSRFRRRGHAQKMIKVCEDRGREWGYDQVFLHVDAEEPSAVALYDKLQYLVIKEDPLWMKLFQGVRLRYMTKPL